MSSVRIATITLQARDVALVARFWRDLLDYSVAPNHTDSVLLCGDGPALLIQPSGSPSAASRIHLDLRPEDPAAATRRALDLGARRVDIGQDGGEGWTVLEDPEGNLFCILQGRQQFETAQASNPGAPTPID